MASCHDGHSAASRNRHSSLASVLWPVGGDLWRSLGLLDWDSDAPIGPRWDSALIYRQNFTSYHRRSDLLNLRMAKKRPPFPIRHPPQDISVSQDKRTAAKFAHELPESTQRTTMGSSTRKKKEKQKDFQVRNFLHMYLKSNPTDTESRNPSTRSGKQRPRLRILQIQASSQEVRTRPQSSYTMFQKK